MDREYTMKFFKNNFQQSNQLRIRKILKRK